MAARSPSLLPFLAAAFLTGSCVRPAAEEPTTFGVLPTAVTDANPSWVPFRIRAGQHVPPKPQERHFSELRQLTFDGRSSTPVWRADSRALFYLSHSGEQPPCAALYQLDLHATKPTRKTPPEHCVSSAAIAGKQIIVSMSATADSPCGSGGDDDDCQMFALTAGEPPRALGEARAAEHIAVSLDQAHYAFVAESSLFTTDAAGTKPQRIAGKVAAWVSFAPNGTALLWQSKRERGDQVILAGPRGQHPQALGPFGQTDRHPVFLPDSRRIAFSSDYDSVGGEEQHNFELYLFDPKSPTTSSGLPPIERISYHPARDGEPSFSPDGVHLAFSSSRGSDDAAASDIYVARWAE